MAKFEKNDWVKIIPTPDTKSDVWTSSHNKFCDRIGQIIEINDQYDDMLLFRVSVHFDYKQTSIYGAHSAWFEDKHVIKSSKWEDDRIHYLNSKFEEYKKFEIASKKKRDEILKQIFSDPYKDNEESRRALNEIRDLEEIRDMENWVYGDGWFMKDFDDI